LDGVAINGVSGGPVFDISKSELRIIGTVAAYIANRATGETLPGLAVAQDVSHFHDIALHIKSIDEANKKKQTIEQEIPPPPSPMPPVPGDIFPDHLPQPNLSQTEKPPDQDPAMVPPANGQPPPGAQV
jgi:hypothetical protein